MPKRRLRIVKHAGPIPRLGICECCNSQFPSDKATVRDAKEEIANGFNAHQCRLLDSSQNALRIVREATEGK